MNSNNLGKEIGARLGKLRAESNQTQQEVADALGVKRETVNQWESGTRQIKADAVMSLAEHFSVSADYILGLTNVQTTDPDTRQICAYTGLSEIAVERLHNLHNRKEYSLAVEILNSLYLRTIDGDISSWETVVDYTRKAANAFNGQFPSPYKDEYINPHDLMHFFIRAAADTVTHELQNTIRKFTATEAARMKAEEDNG